MISSLISSVISWLFSSVLFSLHVFVFFTDIFPVIDIYSYSVVVGKDTWYNFSFLKFIKAWFVTQDMIYSGECCMSTREESVFGCFWMECPINIKSILFNVSFKACVSLFIFMLYDLSTCESGVLNSYYDCVTVDFPFMAVSICLMYWGAPMLGA